MIFIRMDGPQAHDHSVEGSCQQNQISRSEFLSPPEQAYGDKEIGKKKTPEPRTRWYRAEFRQRYKIRHGGDNSYGKDADRKIGGPRYLLSTVQRLRSGYLPRL
jgi:hypothetical protein